MERCHLTLFWYGKKNTYKKDLFRESNKLALNVGSECQQTHLGDCNTQNKAFKMLKIQMQPNVKQT